MKSILALSVLLGVSSAHQIVTHLWVGGNPDQSCVRVASSTDPITDLQSPEMACNVVRGNAKSKCAVKAGDEIGFEWRAQPNTPPAQVPQSDGENVGVTDTSHMGPCFVYAKKVSDALTAEGPGDGWFKIAEDGLDGNGVFCTTRLREANAPQTIKIPASMEPGDYLLRAEFLTLNNAGSRRIGGQAEPQVYPGCVQVTIESSGTAKPSETVSIPGYYQFDQSSEQGTPGLIFDIWNSQTFSNYPMPGPALFADGSSSKPENPAPTSAAAAPTNSPVAEEPSEPSEEPSEEPSQPSEVPEATAPVVLPTGTPDPRPAASVRTRRRTRTRIRTSTAAAPEPTQDEAPALPTALPDNSEGVEGDAPEIPQAISSAPIIAEPSPVAPTFLTVTQAPTATSPPVVPTTTPQTPSSGQCGPWCRFFQRIRKFLRENMPSERE